MIILLYSSQEVLDGVNVQEDGAWLGPLQCVIGRWVRRPGEGRRKPLDARSTRPNVAGESWRRAISLSGRLSAEIMMFSLFYILSIVYYYKPFSTELSIVGSSPI